MKNKKRILFITPLPPSPGGVATAMDAILSSSIWDKYNIEILDISRKAHFGEQAKFTLYNISTALNHLLKLLKKCVLKRPHIVHLPVTSYFALLKSAGLMFIAKIFYVKTVIHLHGGAFDKWYFDSPKLVQNLIKFVLFRADRVIALSTKWASFLREIGLPNEKIKVLNNPVRREFIDYSLKRKQLNKKADKRINVVFVGSIGERKGLYDILESIIFVKGSKLSLHFKFIGNEEKSGEKQHIIEEYTQAGAMEYCEFKGFLSGRKLIREIANSDIFILPSHNENYPVSILEAMALGLPVISTLVGGVPEIVENGVNGYLIKPGDVELLSEKILYLARHPEIRERMAKLNRIKARELFAPDVIAKKLQSIFNELL